MKIDYRDGRYYLDDKPYFVVSSEYMYFRDARDNWEDRLTKLKEAGVQVINSYIPWRHHLRIDKGKRSYDFTGETKDSRDVMTFLKTVEKLGFKLILKPGPFIHSELNVGGLPDLVSPSFNPSMPPVRRHHGGPAYWGYDASQLPAPYDERFDDLAKEWFKEVRKVIEPFYRPDGPLIGIQLVDETIYCASNDPPWFIGYEPSSMRTYREKLADKYTDIGTYNHLHGTDHPSFDFVSAPTMIPLNSKGRTQTRIPQRPKDLLTYIDWADWQWRYRRDLYERYKNYLNIDLPHLTNYAGITPPIVENVPDQKTEFVEVIHEDFQKLYAEWWFGMNRVDTDVDVHEYGLISWLGVAAYDRAVFDRYINTARRARGINMEENWGFATLYDHRSKYPLICFFQTLLSIAGGATGYDVFVGVGSGYWDDTLDKTTKLQCPTFPSDAPLDEHGNKTALYPTVQFLNEWFIANGEDLLRCELETDCAYLLYAPYAAVSSWIPDKRYWGIEEHDIPRCGHQGLEEFSRSLQDAGYTIAMFELEAATLEKMQSCRSLAIHTAFYMGEREQQLLASYIADGGTLFISGELPSVDLQWRPCTILMNAIESAVSQKSPNVVYRRENLFADGQFAKTVSATGLAPNVTYSPDLRACVHRNAAGDEFFVFFFNFDVKGSHEKFIEFYGQKLSLTVGSKTCGVLRVKNGRIVAHLIKGTNEVENITDTIRLQLGDQKIEGKGDFSNVG